MMKKITLLLIFTISIWNVTYAGNCSNPNNPDWFEYYSFLFHATDFSSENCLEPSVCSSMLTGKSRNENCVQLVYLNNTVSNAHYVKQFGQQTRYQPFSVARGRNQHTQDRRYEWEREVVEVTSVQIMMPNNTIIQDDGTICISFDSPPMCGAVDPSSGNSIYNSEHAITNIRYIQVLANDTLVGQVSYKGNLSLKYTDLYGKCIKLVVVYNSGEIQEFYTCIDNNIYDKTKCGPRPSIDNFLCGLDPDVITESSDIPNNTEPFIAPPNFDDDCNPEADFQIDVTATIPYLDHPSLEQISQNELDQYYDDLQDWYWNGGPKPQYPSGTLYEDQYNSNSNLGVYNGDENSTPELGSIIASVYLNPNNSTITKPIIITDGIDFTSTRDATQILALFGGNATMQALFDEGYDIIVADYKGGADFMQKNAYALIELIRTVKSDYNLDEIPAIIGPSMGGQVVRYALLKWESELEEKPEYGPHNVKLFLSADSPWMGANAAPCLQVGSSILKNQDETMLKVDIWSNAPATRQLLIHHGTAGYNPFKFEYEGKAHDYRNSFMQEIADMGNSPKQPKIIAIADGGNAMGIGVIGYDPAGFVLPGEDLMSQQVQDWRLIFQWWENGPHIFIDGIIKFSTVNEGDKLVSYEGQNSNFINNQVRKKLNLEEDIVTTGLTISGLDSTPGSAFDLPARIASAGGAPPGLDVLGTFTFIPTFSALAVDVTSPGSTSSPTSDFTNADHQSDIFENIFLDHMDSEHTDFTQYGSANFLLTHLPGEPGQYLDPCSYIDQVLSNQQDNVINFENGDNTINANFQYISQHDLHYYYASEFEFCIPDLNMMTLNNNVAILNQETTVLSDDCGILQYWDDENNMPVFVSNIYEELPETCSVTVEFCLSWNDPFDEEGMLLPVDEEGQLLEEGELLCMDEPLCTTITINADMSTNFQDTDPIESRKKSNSDDSKSQLNEQFEVYPNPSMGEVSIITSGDDYQISVISTDGREISSQVVKGIQTKRMTLPSGQYFIKGINMKTGESSVKKIFIF